MLNYARAIIVLNKPAMLYETVLAVQPLHCAALQCSALLAVVSFAVLCNALRCIAVLCRCQRGGAVQRFALQRWLCLAVVCTMSMVKVHFGL